MALSSALSAASCGVAVGEVLLLIWIGSPSWFELSTLPWPCRSDENYATTTPVGKVSDLYNVRMQLLFFTRRTVLGLFAGGILSVCVGLQPAAQSTSGEPLI